MEFRNTPVTSIPERIENYFRQHASRKIHIIIIGANNGITEDFLSAYMKKSNSVGVLVEPVSYLFKTLQETFKGYSDLYFENSAVYTKNCKRAFYRVEKAPELPDWAEGLGSFNKKNILHHVNQVPALKSHLVKETVNCLTFDALVKKYNFNTIDILQIDVEGYDFEIIKNIDFETHRPKMIIVEILHLSIYECFALINYLTEKQYTVSKNANTFDLFATDNLQSV
ncbi:MAG: FkbM family methyltransferase [Chitinophagaceae bacterium]